ncbi:MAG: ABC transporter permease, partial [Armatimonadetes bacterium]|nr:ABC transporter permease [Armatimonadota bacterium]
MIERFLLRTALRDLVTIRRAAVAAVLVLGPACVGLVIRIGTRAEFDGVAAYGALASLLVFGFVLPILAVVFGTGAVSQEIEQRTIVYLLTRPIARWRILLVKYIAAWITISCTGLLALVVLATATYEPGKTT